MPLRRLLGWYAAWTAGLLVVFALAYQHFLCGLPHDTASWVVSWSEALNYSVQTLTTVGYGNWWPGDPPCHVAPSFPIPVVGTLSGIQIMKMLSTLFMLVGAFFFSVTVALAVEWIRLGLEREEG